MTPVHTWVNQRITPLEHSSHQEVSLFTCLRVSDVTYHPFLFVSIISFSAVWIYQNWLLGHLQTQETEVSEVHYCKFDMVVTKQIQIRWMQLSLVHFGRFNYIDRKAFIYHVCLKFRILIRVTLQYVFPSFCVYLYGIEIRLPYSTCSTYPILLVQPSWSNRTFYSAHLV